MYSDRYKKMASKNGSQLSFYEDVQDSVLVFSELTEQIIPWWEIEKVVREPIKRRFYQVFLLHEDETIKEDITEYVIPEGNLEIKYNQGQTRTLTLTILNPEKIWNPSPINGKIWHNTKFKLLIGIEIYGGEIYYVSGGVFVCNDPELSNKDANKIITIQCYDKFALFDGTVNGQFDTLNYQIARGEKIEVAINQVLRLAKDKHNNPFDPKPIIFPEKFKNERVTYTMKIAAPNNLGGILISLADVLSCDVFFDSEGRLTLREGNLSLNHETKEVAWEYLPVKEGHNPNDFPIFVSKANYTKNTMINYKNSLYSAKRDLYGNFEEVSELPENPEEGDSYYITSEDRNYLYTENEWVEVGVSVYFKMEEWTLMDNSYSFEALEFSGVSLKPEWSKIRNKFVVVGANSGSGFYFQGIAENTNTKSPYNVNSLFGVKVEFLVDKQIRSSALCEERARYELKKNMQKYIQINFDSIYIPHLLPNDLVRWTFPDYDFYDELFLVDSVSIPLDPKASMTVALTNINELPI